MMTCKEKLIKDHPEWSKEKIEEVVVDHCPFDYRYLGRPDGCHYNNVTDSYCRLCWDREIYDEDDVVTDDAMTIIGTVLGDPKVGAIKDSGDRTEFSTGAVRDMREGKGRCDLMPLEVVAEYFRHGMYAPDPKRGEEYYWILHSINDFKRTDYTKTDFLYQALAAFEGRCYDYTPTMFLEVAKHFEEGAKKYGENNWQKGIPTYCYIDSAVRHFLKWARGDNDERHDRAFVWNLMCCIWEVDYHKETN